MGLLFRLTSRLRRSQAASLEAQGRLDDAFQAYRNEGSLDDAARVMILQAETTIDPNRRLAILTLAASVSPQSPSGTMARQRKALLTLDLLKNSERRPLCSDAHRLGEELEQLGLMREAADAYAFTDDLEARSRTLASCGAIEELEKTYEVDRSQKRETSDREVFFQHIQDLDSLGQRREAISELSQALNRSPHDQNLQGMLSQIREKLAVGPTLPVRIGEQDLEVCPDSQIVIGRSDATISVPSPVLSRSHVIIEMGASGPELRDMGSRNGTYLAGARINGVLPISDGIEINIGNQVLCTMHKHEQTGIIIQIANRRIWASFGPCPIGPFRIERGQDNGFNLLSGQVAPVLGKLIAKTPLNLSHFDEIRASLKGPVEFRLPGW